MLKTFLFNLLLLSLVGFSVTGKATLSEFERYEGGFFYFPDTPNTLYLIGVVGRDVVRSAAGLSLRRAIRNHNVDKLVLISEGGYMEYGLEYAWIVRDNKIAVYIPPNAPCLSACSFIFFGGVERYSEGSVGVHQFYEDSDRRQNVRETQEETLSSVGDILATLNSFDVPPHIYEHMFSKDGSEMYYLNINDLRKLGVTSRQNWHSEVDALLEKLNKSAAQSRTQTTAYKATTAPETDTPTLDHDGLPVAWGLQLASFKDERNARALQTDLLKAGYKTYIRRSDTLVRVYIGPEMERSRLETLKESIKRDFALDGMITRFTIE